MKAIVWIIVSIAFLYLGYHAYKKSKMSDESISDKLTNANKSKIKITTESCEVLKRDEVVNYFRSLQLIKGEDIPFVARANFFKQFLTNAPIQNNEYNVVLGVYNEPSKELKSIKNVDTKQWDSDFATMIGKEDIIVLA